MMERLRQCSRALLRHFEVGGAESLCRAVRVQSLPRSELLQRELQLLKVARIVWVQLGEHGVGERRQCLMRMLVDGFAFRRQFIAKRLDLATAAQSAMLL